MQYLLPAYFCNIPVINLNNAEHLQGDMGDELKKKETKVEKKDEDGNVTKEKKIEKEEKEDD